MRLDLSVPLVGVINLVALAVQLSMNIQLVVSGRSGTRIDMLGFVGIMFTGVILAANEVGRGTLRTKPILCFVAFWLYIAVVISFTSQASVIAVFFSKYGILTWTLAGSFASLAISAIGRRTTPQPRVARWRFVAYSLPVVMLCIVLIPLRTYMASPVPIESYQFAAANATILFITTLVSAAHLASTKSRYLFMVEAMIVIVLCTTIMLLVSRMNSTSIVMVWVVLALLYVRSSGKLFRARFSSLLAGSLIGVGLWFLGTEAFLDFLESTRFRELESGNMQLSSWQARVDLLPTFWSQFSISPVTGDFEAEVLAGYLPGEYIHSLPLSLLTHAGIVGTAIFAAATFFAAKRPDADKVLAPERALVRHIFFWILLAATLTTFFLWIPLWFIVGYMLIQPRNRRQQPVLI